MDKLRGIVAKIFLVCLFSVLILSFAVWGIGDIFRGQSVNPPVAAVGDIEITQDEYRSALSRQFTVMRQRFQGNFDIEMARAVGLPQQVLQSLISRALFEQAANDLDMVVTDDQVRAEIFATPAFQGLGGRFDRFRFEQVLRTNGLSEATFVASLRRDIKREQIAAALASGVVTPQTLSEALYAYREEKRVAEHVTLPLASLADAEDPDAATLEAFYQGAQASFMAPEYRSVIALSLTPEQLFDEITVSEEDLRIEFEDRAAEFIQPERRQVLHIIFDNVEAAEAARAQIDEGRTFAAIAEAETGQAPVDLGNVTQDGMIVELAEPAFALALQEVSAPVESPFGWHLLQVTEILPGVRPEFADVVDLLREDVQRRNAIDGLISIANQLDDELAGGASLEEAANLLGLELIRVEALDRNGRGADGEAVPGLPGTAAFLEVAFDTEAGMDSLLTGTDDGGYFVLHVDGVTPAQPRPLAEVGDELLALWHSQDRLRRAQEQAEAFAERLRGGESLADLAEAESLPSGTTAALTRFSSEPSSAVAGALFTINPGEVTVADSPEGPMVLVLTSIQAADPVGNEAALTALAERTENELRGELLIALGRSLERKHGVEINSGLVEEALVGY
jgi:peptidyl-prolyl cis-trans isomerase D